MSKHFESWKVTEPSIVSEQPNPYKECWGKMREHLDLASQYINDSNTSSTEVINRFRSYMRDKEREITR